MTEIITHIAALRRPKLLIRAARLGLQDYVRERDLARALRQARAAGGAALERLLAEEAQLESTRRAGDATYSVARHVEVLIALLAESRLSPRRGEQV
jgi:hypothetical protein